MIRGSRAFLAALILLAGCSAASAQDATIGAGKVEIGGFPGGGTFFVGGDDNKEVNFNVYTAGGGLTYYFNKAVALEGEFTGSVGWAQDVMFNNAKLIHNQMPTVWSYSGNVVFFPGGTTNNENEAFDPGNNSWQKLAPMPAGRHATMAAVAGDKLYIAAGSLKPGAGEVTNQLIVFTLP